MYLNEETLSVEDSVKYWPMQSIKNGKEEKNGNANYCALHSVKCTAVGTVSAPWTAKFVCILTVG